MSTTPDNPPAFPVAPQPEIIEMENTPHARRVQEYAPGHPGMTLRDYFAGQALAGLIGTSAEPIGFDVVGNECYKYADAMLTARTPRPA